MSNSVCALVPLITVTTGIFASAAALNCASASTGLPIATMIASTLRWIRSSSCCACFGRLPSELRICTFQPFAVAASFAALATRACVSDDIWNATMPTSNAKAGVASAASAAAQDDPFHRCPPYTAKAARLSVLAESATAATMVTPSRMSCMK